MSDEFCLFLQKPAVTDRRYRFLSIQHMSEELLEVFAQPEELILSE